MSSNEDEDFQLNREEGWGSRELAVGWLAVEVEKRKGSRKWLERYSRERERCGEEKENFQNKLLGFETRIYSVL